jgi:hypothetical protein
MLIKTSIYMYTNREKLFWYKSGPSLTPKIKGNESSTFLIKQESSRQIKGHENYTPEVDDVEGKNGAWVMAHVVSLYM